MPLLILQPEVKEQLGAANIGQVSKVASKMWKKKTFDLNPPCKYFKLDDFPVREKILGSVFTGLFDKYLAQNRTNAKMPKPSYSFSCLLGLRSYIIRTGSSACFLCGHSPMNPGFCSAINNLRLTTWASILIVRA